MTDQPRHRAVFSTEDFALLKRAVGDYLEKVKDTPESIQAGRLYHRLGRLD